MGGCFGFPTSISISFPEFELEANTGDIILFTGSGIVSRFIEYATISKYSHAATIVKNEKTHEIFILESTIFDSTKDIYGKKKGGVRLIPAFDKFNAYLNQYGPGFYWIKLKVPKDIHLMDYSFERNIEWIQRQYNKPYEVHIDELAYAALPVIPEGIFAFTNGPDATPQDSYFCSELSVDHLKFLNAANPDIVSTTVGPNAFDAKYPIVRGVPLLKPGYSFDSMVAVGFI